MVNLNSNSSTTTGIPELGSGLDFDSDEQGCLHEALERSRPPNKKGGAHMLVCNCPKCTTWC